MKKIKIGIIWANPYNRNLGVAALAYSSLAFIQDTLSSANIDCEITFFGSTKFTKDKLEINGTNYSFDNIRGLNLKAFKSHVKQILKPQETRLHELKKFDYVFDIAEGDSFTDIYGQDRFESILNSKLYFSKNRIKQFLMPQTVGPFNNPENEKRAFDAMQKIERIVSRDQKSFNYTKTKLPEEKLAETIDIAFYMPYEQNKFENDKINVGLNVSGLLWNGGYTQNNQFGLKSNYKDLILETVKYFISIPNIQLHLVGHVLANKAGAIEDDYAACKKIHAEFPNTILAPWFQTPIDAKSYISGLDFFMGARMHSCIAAFSTGVPVFPMAYSRKFNGLFGDTLQYPFMGDCVNEENKTIISNMIESFKNREKLKTKIDHAKKNIINPRLDKLGKLISDFVKYN